MRLIAVMAAVHVALPVSYLTGGEVSVNAFLTNDDTYYYLQTAWNAGRLGFVTFDGINPTNGVQFLWFGILYLLGLTTATKTTFLQLAVVTAIALTCVPYMIIWWLSRRPTTPTRSVMGVMMAALWLLVCLYRPNQYLVALESPLHAAIIWSTVLLYMNIYRQAQTGTPHAAALIGMVVLLVLNTWTRLDSFGLSAAFFVLTVWTVRHRPPAIGVYAVSALLVACGIVTLFGFFQWAGGSLLPVSALVKGHIADRASLGAFYNWSLVLFPVRVQGANLLNILGIVAMGASLSALVRSRAQAGDYESDALRICAVALGVAVVIHSIATFGMFRYYYFWYLSASFIYWTIVLAWFGSEWVVRKQLNPRTAAIAVCAASLVTVAAWRVTTPPDNLSSIRYEAGRWIDANLEPDALIASFNAGQLGFFSNRPVVNLDGLINHVSYFEAVLQADSPEALAAYLDRLGVDYVVDYGFGRWRESLERDFTTIKEFGLGSGSTLKIMKRASRAWRREPGPSYAVSTFRTDDR